MSDKPRFPNVSCSQCGQSFGPGDHGFSHCKNHAGLRSKEYTPDPECLMPPDECDVIAEWAAARDAAIEECAKACDAVGLDWEPGTYRIPAGIYTPNHGEGILDAAQRQGAKVEYTRYPAPSHGINHKREPFEGEK